MNIIPQLIGELTIMSRQLLQTNRTIMGHTRNMVFIEDQERKKEALSEYGFLYWLSIFQTTHVSCASR